MKRILLLLSLALIVVSSWGQNVPGYALGVNYKDGANTLSQVFRLDSVDNYGYVGGNVFVKSSAGPQFTIPASSFESFTFAPIVSDSVNHGQAGDYLVVNVGGQTAAFLLSQTEFEMTWKGGVLAIKDAYQSQSIGLRSGITFSIERRSFGYTNPNISSAPGSGKFYLIVEMRGLTKHSFDDQYSCVYRKLTDIEGVLRGYLSFIDGPLYNLSTASITKFYVDTQP